MWLDAVCASSLNSTLCVLFQSLSITSLVTPHQPCQIRSKLDTKIFDRRDLGCRDAQAACGLPMLSTFRRCRRLAKQQLQNDRCSPARQPASFAADASFSLVAIMVSQISKTLFEVSIMQYRNIKVRSLNGYYYQHRNKKLSICQAFVTCHFTYF